MFLITRTKYPGETAKANTTVGIGLVVCIQTVASYTVRSESHCALRLRYVDLVVSIEVAVEVCCCCVTFRCIHPLNSG